MAAFVIPRKPEELEGDGDDDSIRVSCPVPGLDDVDEDAASAYASGARGGPGGWGGGSA
jgi:hypothetical protein